MLAYQKVKLTDAVPKIGKEVDERNPERFDEIVHETNIEFGNIGICDDEFALDVEVGRQRQAEPLFLLVLVHELLGNTDRPV